MKKVKEYYRQRLPHIQPLGAAFFVTFRLFGAVPKVELLRLKQRYHNKLLELNMIEDLEIKNKRSYRLRQDYFLAQEQLLETIKAGPRHLKSAEVANVIVNEIHRFDGKFYELVCYTIMSNHVHLVIDTSLDTESEIFSYSRVKPYKPLDSIMKRIKGPTAVKANRILRRSGQFWDRESFDTYIRSNKMLLNVIHYVLNNSVKAGLVDSWKEWPYTYLAPSFTFKTI